MSVVMLKTPVLFMSAEVPIAELMTVPLTDGKGWQEPSETKAVAGKQVRQRAQSWPVLVMQFAATQKPCQLDPSESL